MTITAPPAATEHAADCQVRTARRRRRLAAGALVLSGCALVGTGVLSGWSNTSSTSSGTLSADSGALTLIDANGGTFSTAVSNLLPGDWFYRYVDVRNDGSSAHSFTGAVSASGDLAGQISVDAVSCSVAWTTVVGVSTCAGTTTSLGSGTPTSSTTVAVSHGSIAVGASQHVRYRMTFSTSAPDTLQGKTGAVSVTVSNSLVGGSDRTGG